MFPPRVKNISLCVLSHSLKTKDDGLSQNKVTSTEKKSKEHKTESDGTRNVSKVHRCPRLGDLQKTVQRD